MKKRLHYSRLISLVVVMVLFINMKGNHLFAQVTPEDKAILIGLYNATNGDSWTDNTNWGSAEPVDTWYGVTVSGDEIIEIDLYQNNLDGIIPANLGQLTSLEFLKLDTNNITGNIPVELGNLASLQQLYLGGNKLEGSIPTSLRLLSNLRWLNLSDNQLSGEIPVELSELTQLEYLQLSKNQLTGNIPTFLGSMANLKWLNLSGNLLTGTIPTELSLLSKINFEQLYLNDNQLNGSIPVDLWTLNGLKWLNLGQNQLTGTIPPVGSGQLTNLSLLYLDGNLLDGSIPATLDQITTLEWLNLGENRLTGNIPDEVWNMTNLKLLYLNGNQLTGAVPVQINLLTELKFVDFDSNQLDAIPDLTALSNLTYLTISNNRFNFEHLEYNMDLISTVNFTYAPQDSIGQSQVFTKNEGETLSYTLATGGSENSYQWYKDGALLGTQISATLEINNLTAADAGNYYCEVTNALVPGLTLTSHEVILLMEMSTGLKFSENELSLNCYPNPFHEIINIEVKLQNNQNLRVEVYDIYSRKVRQLYSGKADGTVKLQWDGSDEQGNKVASGVYLFRVNNTWRNIMLSRN